jgi:hypothetical protein
LHVMEIARGFAPNALAGDIEQESCRRPMGA